MLLVCLRDTILIFDPNLERISNSALSPRARRSVSSIENLVLFASGNSGIILPSIYNMAPAVL